MKRQKIRHFYIGHLSERIRQRAKVRLKDASGETIVETLVTMIILSLAVIMLSGAVVTSARVNAKADNADTAFHVDESQLTQESVVMIITDGSGEANAAKLDVKVYKTENDYIYYEPQKQE